jgi:hypothetical protein
LRRKARSALRWCKHSSIQTSQHTMQAAVQATCLSTNDHHDRTLTVCLPELSDWVEPDQDMSCTSKNQANMHSGQDITSTKSHVACAHLLLAPTRSNRV